ETGRHFDAHRDVEVARRLAGQSRQTLTAQTKHLTTGCPRWNDEDRLPRRRRDVDARAQQGFPDADRDVAVHVVALAMKEWMLSASGAHEQITAWSAEWPRVALAGYADLRAGIDAGGNRDFDRLDDAANATPHAGRASALSGRAGRAALRARRES